MGLLSRTIIVVVTCLLAVPLLVMPAQAQGADIRLSPDSGVPGTEVTLRGYNFTPNESVDICYCPTAACPAISRIWVAEEVDTEDGEFTVRFTIPESYAGAHEVRVYIGASLQAARNFTVRPAVTVSPEEGPVGTNVTVRGIGFAGNETSIELRYYLNGNSTLVASNITADSAGSWQRSFQIPASARGSHKIDARGNSSSFADVQDAFFTVTPVISLGKSSGSVGENITMTGSGFAANERNVTISFAGQEVAADVRVDADALGRWEKNFQVPQKPKGTYNVTAQGESTPRAAVRPLSFEIKPGLVLSSPQGHVGMNLTVTGGGFAVSEDVDVMYDASKIAATTTDAKGSFQVTFAVPESQHGAHNVTARDDVGNNATAIFTMESEPPGIPELHSPADGSRLGFISKVMPAFNWSAVSDASGVRYNLQIATSANLTAAGLANPRLSVPGIAATNHTLNRTQALPHGTYYWVVQAVDRAGNAGNWSAVYSFKAGVLPLWAFIVIIVAAVALAGTLVYFFIIRKRIYYY